MFKIFPGFHLVEEYQRKRKERRLADDQTLSKTIKIIAAVAISLILWLLPTESFGIEGLTYVEQRVIAVFAFATLMWIFEAVPAWVTSVIVMVVLLFTSSDSALWLFREGYDAEALGKLIKYKSIIYCFADPIIMLFLGGFILAIAATKTGMDCALAKVMLKPFGTQSKYVLLGFVLVTGIFSMFLSNTATAAMMLTFLTPVLKALPADGKGKIALAMAIPIGANIGGLGTPIGTPPNAIALKYLNDPEGLNMNLGFGEWMMFMLPFTILILIIGWMLLLKLFPFKQKTINLVIEGEAKKDWRSIIVYITFAVTVLLWVTDKVTGVNSNVVALLPVAVFAGIGVITRRDLEEINWAVLWMVAGGFALGVALDKTGLGNVLVDAIPFANWSPLVVMIISGLVCFVFSNFISHSAAASLLAPILGLVASGILADSTAGSAFAEMGGPSALMVGVAISASVSMILPISTPPNAIAHSTGFIEQKDMMKVGIIMGLLGLVIGYAMLIFFKF